MFADYHVHTEYSDDSVYPMEAVVRDALSIGLDELCFTDHVDYGLKYDWDEIDPMPMRGDYPLANVDYPQYMRQIQDLKEAYAGKIRLKTGMEFGMQLHTIPKFEALFRKYAFDFIILSIHQIENKEFHNQDFQKGRTQQQYNERYYEELFNVIKQYKHYSVLGHLDLITRYDPAGPYPFDRIRPIVEAILKQAIADGKGIEFNTSWHRYGLSDTTPSIDILKLYHSLGGKIITIGSDSHAPAHLGAYIGEAKEILADIGFDAFCTFDKMEPVFHPL